MFFLKIFSQLNFLEIVLYESSGNSWFPIAELLILSHGRKCFPPVKFIRFFKLQYLQK